MNIRDFVETWWVSIKPILESAGVVGHFQRSPNYYPNPSCNLNLRRDESEIDLQVWDSGEAELIVNKPGTPSAQKHFDDIRNQKDLAEILSRLAALAK